MSDKVRYRAPVSLFPADLVSCLLTGPIICLSGGHRRRGSNPRVAQIVELILYHLSNKADKYIYISLI